MKSWENCVVTQYKGKNATWWFFFCRLVICFLLLAPYCTVIWTVALGQLLVLLLCPVYNLACNHKWYDNVINIIFFLLLAEFICTHFISAQHERLCFILIYGHMGLAAPHSDGWRNCSLSWGQLVTGSAVIFFQKESSICLTPKMDMQKLLLKPVTQHDCGAMILLVWLNNKPVWKNLHRPNLEMKYRVTVMNGFLCVCARDYCDLFILLRSCVWIQ